MKAVIIALTVGLFCAIPVAALCADVAGVVSDAHGHLIGGVTISARTKAGKTIARGTTDSQGRYELSGLAEGQYTYALDPAKTGFRAGTAVAFLPGRGLTIDWTLSKRASALALAREGSEQMVAGDPFGLTENQFIAALVGGVAVVAGGTLGGYAAAGGFSSSSGPASPGI
jgi:Carboxypeptidase regulatory-like domain